MGNKPGQLAIFQKGTYLMRQEGKCPWLKNEDFKENEVLNE